MNSTLDMRPTPNDYGAKRRGKGAEPAPAPSMPPKAPKPAAALAAGFVQILDRITYLRLHERTAKADRAACLGFLLSAIDAHRGECQGRHALLDPSDECSLTFDESVRLLHLEYAELTMPGNPYPARLRDGLTPFEQGRYHSGKFFPRRKEDTQTH